VLAAPPAPGFEVARWDGQDRPVGHDHGEGILLFITSGHQIVLPPPGLAMLARAAEELQTYQAGFRMCALGRSYVEPHNTRHCVCGALAATLSGLAKALRKARGTTHLHALARARRAAGQS
jgi:hypothetical protein